MDMDLMDMEEFADFDEEAAEEEGEGQNRLFIIAVAVMSGVLLIGVIAFCAWVLFVGGFIGGRDAVDVTPTADAAALAALTATVAFEETTTAEAAEPTPTEVTPTNTPRPTEAPTTAPTEPTTPEVSPEVTQTEEPSTVGEVTPTLGPRTSPTAPGGTPPPDTVSDTGIGAFTAAIVAIGLLLLLVTARRLRTAR
jgi:cytoskeletal protein RodZ